MTRQKEKTGNQEKGGKGRQRKTSTVKRKTNAGRLSENDEPLSKKLKLIASNEFKSGLTGVLLTLGEGSFGQLGLGEDILTRKKPALVKRELEDKKIKKVVAGGMHTICLTDDHEVYTFGCNDEGSLGRATPEDTMEFEPGRVGGPIIGKNIIDITAGDSHSAALTDEGEVYMWGCFRDNHGKLGLVTEWKGTVSPVRLDTDNIPIQRIDSGNDHIAMITADGQVMTVGCGEQGQLGRISRYFLERGTRRKPENLYLKAKIVRIPKAKGTTGKPVFSEVYCGSYFTFVVSTDGDVFAFGLNNYNQLGLPDEESKYMPVHIPALSKQKWKMISGGQHHSLLLDEKGEVYSIGRGDYGRLGLGEDVTQANMPTKVEGLSDIIQVDAGPCVSFAVGKSGEAFGWGMGTNLQLTTGENDDEWKPIPLTGKNLEERAVLMASGGGQHTALLACDKSLRDNGINST